MTSKLSTLWRTTAWALIMSIALMHSARAQETIIPNFSNVDINSLIGVVSKMTGRNFLVDPRVKAKITVVSNTPVDANELYEIFQSVLQVHGFAAVEQGDVIKILPEVTAKQGPIPNLNEITGSASQRTDQLVTHVFRINNVSAAQLVPILRPMIPQQGHLAAAQGNSLIVTDRAANIARLKQIIRRVDVPDNDEIDIVRLKNAAAGELVRLLSSIQPQAIATGDPGSARLAADERSNAILISGDKSSRLRMRALIEELDVPLEKTGNTKVVYLRYAKAADMMNVLKGVSAGQSKIGVSGSEETETPQVNTAVLGNDLVDIQADEQTNSLIITAPPDAMSNLTEVINQLDIRRAQVLVEAVIAEVSETTNRQLGSSFASYDPTINSPTLLSNTSGGLSSLATAAATQNYAGILNNGLSAIIGGNAADSTLALVVQAIAADSNNNILSTPSLVTLDNQEAEIVDGQNIPLVTGQQTNSSGNPFTTIERRDIGLHLRVKPQINEGNTIKLELFQELSSIADDVAASDIVTSKRSVNTTVLVEDGQTLVLGGLLREEQDDTDSNVPGLSDIPIIGEAFRSRSATNKRRNLMIFIRPVILRDEESGTRYSQRKYNFIRNEQLSARGRHDTLLPSRNLRGALPELRVFLDPSLIRYTP